ncbi:amidase [Streptomyces aidingensis]|uniref:Aspartyl-tRNA(Asn)/glutamyl-tRNA(Gln) amidotransferase subunit A n=1 Tax=Streptomyces aidingensis TaxID=910347 RepID=A0A1I1RHR6_9ACTN|nr:amidase [Streptomyces aidingensis]SFD33712.1 aspartyl-tRNA(Asn)/glutamyl-tRNA(Gln) amidotransferase subunit A [Streptomyces aidingensis]
MNSSPAAGRTAPAPDTGPEPVPAAGPPPTAAALTAAYAAGELSPVEATEAALARAEAGQRQVNAFVLIDAEGALQQARASERRWRAGAPAGPLDGVPVTVKDMLLMRGHPTRRGSALSALAAAGGGPCPEDAPAVARLRESGAVLLAKTTTPELGWKAVTDSPACGATGNPHDPARTAGGSSGGAAAAVALGAGPLALGTDGGGSVRIPAAFCGVLGFKATYGRVPAYPASAFGTLAHVGPLALDPVDAALLMDVVCAPDPRDWSHLGPPPPGGFAPDQAPPAAAGGDAGGRPLAGLRIAWSPALGHPGTPDRDGIAVAPEIAGAVRRLAEGLAGLGARVEETDPPVPTPAALREAFQVLWFSGAARATQHLTEEEAGRLDPGLREIRAEGAARSALEYLAAVDTRMALGHTMGLFHQRYDLLLTPAVPVAAFGLGREVPEGSGLGRWTEWAPFSHPFNLTQQPAVSLPCGRDGAGLPVAAQLVAARHADGLLLRTARFLYAAGLAGPELPSPPAP